MQLGPKEKHHAGLKITTRESNKTEMERRNAVRYRYF
jgi:hypothetical protein